MATGSLSSVPKRLRMVEDFSCTCCLEQNLTESADIYCEQCLRFYCKKCVILHSQLFTKHMTCGREDIKKWPVSKAVEDFLRKCEVHADESLTQFCHDHGQLCCSACVGTNHRLCKEVTLISESLKTNPSDLHELSNKIETILKELKNLHNTKQTSFQSVEGLYSERLQEVRDVRQKLNSALDNLEKATLKELDDVRTSLQAALKTDVENCNKLMDDLELLSEAVKELADKSIGEMAFIATRKCLDKIQESAYLKNTSLKFDSSIAFQANTDIEQYLTKQCGIGKISHKSVQGFTVTKKCEYDLKIPTDGTASYNTGICVISSGNILVADCDNKQVKLLNQQYKVISHCDMDVYFGGNMCQISASEVAVTVDDGLQFIYVAKLQLVEGRRLQFQHTCAGIAHHEGNLYVSSGTALYQYTMTGALVKKIYEDTTASYSAWKCAVSPTGDRIYITNLHQHKLITLAMNGKILSTFTDPELHQPWSVHVSVEGHVLVCGYSSHTIIQVDREGKIKLATLGARKDGLINPVSVCYNSDNHTVMVGQYQNNKLYVLEVQ